MLLDGYVRVSQVGGREGESFISPLIQREQIEGWAAQHGATIAHTFEELDQSGARADRPLLNEALGRVEEGESEGLIVAKLDRFGRSMLDGLRMLQRIEAAGGRVVSVQDGFDLNTATGRLVFQLLLSIGEWELERVRTNWNTARARANARGVYNAPVPYGYRRGDDGRLRVIAELAEQIRAIYEKRADGQSSLQIANWLNEAGAKTQNGNPFNQSKVYLLISNPVYRGEARHGVYRNPEAHEPIVDRALWQRCQYAIHPRRRKIRSPLHGLVRCGSCGKKMALLPSSGPNPRHHRYLCSFYRGCSEPAVARGDQLDPLVEAFVFRRVAAPRPGSEEEIETCEAALAEADQELIAFRDEPLLLSALGAKAFSEGLAERRLQVEKKLVDLARLRRAERTPIDLGRLESEWGELSWDGRRAAFGELIDCVLVEPGPEPLHRRVWVFRAGKGPIGIRDRRLTLSSRSIAEDGERALKPRRWPAARLEVELGEFLAGRPQWPAYREFAEGGRARLHAQVLRYGGPYYWAHRLGCEIPREFVQWRDELIRDALAPLLVGRANWPSAEEFERAGMAAVRRAVQANGGCRHWAGQFGIEYGATRRIEWTREHVAKELRCFTAGRSEFPPKSEFFAGGRKSLYSAMIRQGGVRYWRARLKLSSPGGRAR